MKRDLALATHILLRLEEAPPTLGWVDLDIENHKEKEVSYHIKLLHDVGLIEALDGSTMGNFEWKAKSLTWAGHDFLDGTRESGWLETVREKALDKSVDSGIAAIMYALKKYLSGNG